MKNLPAVKFFLPLIALVLLLAGCETRSISDSGFRPAYGWGRSANPLYKGELTELDILGAAPRQEATAANIAHALATASAPRLKRGDKVILIQSGAPVPDHAMLDEAARYFAVAPFSGLPPEERTGMAESLRLRAAQGGYRYIVCYWGVLESAQVDKEGKALSWVPIVGSFVPDQKQQMRLRLKALLVDVETGGWKMLTPEVHSGGGYNSHWSRESSDQRLVQALKEKGYRSLAAELAKE
ncbi:MAG: aminopeptidase [Opitutae bacterium]|nr:aminopeptidase [Opitutae bacterium]